MSWGAVVIIILGLWDDVKRIPPRNKILGQVIAAIILLKGGVGSHCLDPLLNPINVHLPDRVRASFSFAAPDYRYPELELRRVPGGRLLQRDESYGRPGRAVRRRNRRNRRPGFLFLAVQLAMFSLEPDWDAVRIVLALSLLGAVLGFVPYNFNPASIFMGDAGSMFLGYSCATLIILLAQEQAKWLLAALVMFALPILDTALAFVRRWVNRRPLFSADRHHLHHQLVARGFSVRKTVVISYGLAIGFCLLGMLIAYMRTRYAIAFYLVIFGSLIVAAYKMGLVHEKLRVVSPNHWAQSMPLSPAGSILNPPWWKCPTPPPPTWPGIWAPRDRPEADRSPEDQSTGGRMTPAIAATSVP